MIGLQVSFHSTTYMKHENDVSNMFGYLQLYSCENFKFHERNKTIRTHFMFLFVKTKNNNLHHIKNKTCPKKGMLL